MQLVDSFNDFEVLLGCSLDICVLEVEGEPFHNVIKLHSYLDFDKSGMVEVKPSFCYVDDYLEQMDLYKDIWDYASDFTSFKIPLSIEDDAIKEMINNLDIVTNIIMKADELKSLRRLGPGFYLVGFEYEDEDLSSSTGNE